MGKLIPFYVPAPRPKPAPPALVVEPETDGPTVKDIIGDVQVRADSLADILIIFRNNDGVLGFTTNVGGLAEAILLIEETKHKALALYKPDGNVFA
jgi:hypothetical protein